MSETTTHVAPCDIRSVDTRRLLARADADGLLLHCRYARRSYRLTWQDIEEAKQLALRAEKATLLVKQVVE
jgi:hypothetical protein